jgi:GTP diphosphokinase / guanosine-3',5'-bis(diphosphate) 3'-diphosphatase
MIRFEDLIEKVRATTPDADIELLRRAYVFSAFEHKGQVRHSGEPYLVHPLEVADLLADMARFSSPRARSGRRRTSARCCSRWWTTSA